MNLVICCNRGEQHDCLPVLQSNEGQNALLGSSGDVDPHIPVACNPQFESRRWDDRKRPVHTSPSLFVFLVNLFLSTICFRISRHRVRLTMPSMSGMPICQQAPDATTWEQVREVLADLPELRDCKLESDEQDHVAEHRGIVARECERPLCREICIIPSAEGSYMMSSNGRSLLDDRGCCCFVAFQAAVKASPCFEHSGAHLRGLQAIHPRSAVPGLHLSLGQCPDGHCRLSEGGGWRMPSCMQLDAQL